MEKSEIRYCLTPLGQEIAVEWWPYARRKGAEFASEHHVNPDDAESTAAAVLIRLIAHHNENRDDISGYIRRYTYNAIKNFWVHRGTGCSQFRPMKPLPEFFDVMDTPSNSDPETEDRIKSIRDAVAPEDWRIVSLLFGLDGTGRLTHAKVAERVGLTPDQTKEAVNRVFTIARDCERRTDARKPETHVGAGRSYQARSA